MNNNSASEASRQKEFEEMIFKFFFMTRQAKYNSASYTVENSDLKKLEEHLTAAEIKAAYQNCLKRALNAKSKGENVTVQTGYKTWLEEKFYPHIKDKNYLQEIIKVARGFFGGSILHDIINTSKKEEYSSEIELAKKQYALILQKDCKTNRVI